MIIDTRKIYDALMKGTSRSVAERFNIPAQTIRQYRAAKGSKSYRNWRLMRLEVAESMMEIINREEQERKRFERNEFIFITDKSDFRSSSSEGINIGFHFDNDSKYHAVIAVEVIDTQKGERTTSYHSDLKNWSYNSFDIVQFLNINADDTVSKLISLCEKENLPYRVDSNINFSKD